METSGIVVAIFALIFSQITCYVNLFLLLATFWLGKIQRKLDMTLIYSRFGVDVLYAFMNSVSLAYLLIRAIFPNAVIKNLSFFIAWPTFNLGTIRFFVVLFITSDRVFASCFPIFYHRHRSKIPNVLILSVIFMYFVFEQFILFKICDFVLDVPMSCLHVGCSVGSCYRSYWLYFEQIGYFSIGILSVILCFRLFIWNYFARSQNNKEISRLFPTCHQWGAK
ncbi:hypothetical protein CAEBREN_19593 [Caenorhabditis brenneri]|uniref:G-protein coupled receptors family 1 profile domain-containing protein n=1 Tax=Caenorhabditis brenneri TaxID=135651 RepID=G0NEF3_CAEBE|nr:hypothetical protein CAEBREN_19593 [Caenorhabditis brenneri]